MVITGDGRRRQRHHRRSPEGRAPRRQRYSAQRQHEHRTDDGRKRSGRVRASVRADRARFEAFNFFNTPWFGAPNTNVTSTAFGTVAPNQANDPRNIQFGVRLTF